MACVRRRRGKYVVDWRHATGRRRWETFEKKKDAQARRDEVSQQKRQGLVVNEKLTLDEEITRYRRDHIKLVRKSTAGDYDALLRLYIEPYFAGWRMRGIQRKEVLKFRTHLEEKGVGWRTTNKVLGLLGAIFRFTTLDGQIHHNPTAKTTLPKPESSEEAYA
ncbi:MAG: hypothetical protein GWN84_07675 [Gammaproteobacteria bacterium]|nr:hypothetical protein [Gammaproteobacteria bacterium]NIR82761.1 hypothetical protein [Gammaproteobacteria bacterium]NIR89625.1 hypothetical protein [Gammaproteobacteria bacterium]NIU03921.1 hypothetical protein [Gammaproteobacteria bacterium]NIV51237.1 hypothetical protein [Gammaproteobacteria bacterium]